MGEPAFFRQIRDRRMALIQRAGDTEAELERTYDPLQDRLRAAFVSSLVAVVTGVPAADIAGRSLQSPGAARARQVAMYLTYVVFGWPLVRVGHAFGRDRSTAAHACHRVEDRRDDKTFDTYLTQMEDCLRAAPEGEMA